jgi:hypothetical protein
MPVLESAGNTSIESNATDNAAIYIKTGNRAVRIEDLYYAQSKSQSSGWIPIGAETRGGITTVAIKHTYTFQYPPYYEASYQAVDYDPSSGALVGIHAYGGSYFTREQQITLYEAGRNQEIIDTTYFGGDTEGEFLQRFDWVINPSASNSANATSIISAPSTYGKNSADIITNYNPKTDQPIQIDLSSFEGAAGKLKIAKKSNKVAQLAKKNIDFIYDRQQGYLYYNENGKQPGLGDGDIVAILEGKPKAGMGNFAFI